MKQLISKVLFIALSMMLFTPVVAKERVRGNGNVTTKKIKIDQYDKIKIDETLNFIYVQDENEPSLEISIDQNLHDYISINIEESTLEVGVKNGVQIDQMTRFVVRSNSILLQKVIVRENSNFSIETPIESELLEIDANQYSLVELGEKVKVKKLDLKVRGNANMVIENVVCDEVRVLLNGAGSMRFNGGSSKTGNIDVISNGDLHAYDLQIGEADFKMTGQGLVELSVQKKLNLFIMGRGVLNLKGNPEISQRIIGKGRIKWSE